MAMTPPDSLSPQHQLQLDQVDAHSRAMQAYRPPVGLPFAPFLFAGIAGGFVCVGLLGTFLAR